ncbi:glycyl-radical enzyme activating protein [Thermodesulfobacteriota bacterium]
MNPESRRPLIFDIHRYALDDGPGIRTTVFFKGCPLSCFWCHNPEGIRPEPELYYHDQECIACGDCVAVCPHGAVALNGTIRIDRNRCDVCGLCAAQCPSKALSIKGQYYPVATLIETLLQDMRFFENSGGGVTFSGGEPTWHPSYLRRTMQALKAHGIHLALQTSGLFDWNQFCTMLLPFIDLIYFDIKCIDPRHHRLWTGRSNRSILDNLSRLTHASRDKLVCCVPLIDGFTADTNNVRDVANHIGAIADLPYRLHPYHPGVHFKAAALGKSAAPELPQHAMALDQYHHIATTFDTIVTHIRQRR